MVVTILSHRHTCRLDPMGCVLAHIWIRGKEPKRVRFAAWVASAFLLACLPFALSTVHLSTEEVL